MAEVTGNCRLMAIIAAIWVPKILPSATYTGSPLLFHAREHTLHFSVVDVLLHLHSGMSRRTDLLEEQVFEASSSPRLCTELRAIKSF